MKHKWTALALCASLSLGMLCGCGNNVSTGETQSGGGAVLSPGLSAALSASSADEAQVRTPAGADLTGAVTVSLSGTSVQIDGSGAAESDGVITISAGGTYVFSGTLSEGRILVDAKGKDVTLVFNGADITCSYGSPLYVYQAAQTTLHLMEGTQNTLTDGAHYTFNDAYSSAAEEEPNACLYSKDDLVLQGAGALTVNANYNNGITSKDTLTLCDLTLTVQAANHGINGKDSNVLDSVCVTVDCGGDAIRSTNDTDPSLGWITISNSTLLLTAGEDGIQAETDLVISSGTYTIASGGGSGVRPSDTVSSKGLKAGGTLTLASGSYTMDCSDDAFHSNGNVTVSGGVYTVSSGDDAFHADETLTVSGGGINILTCYEGLEGATVDISGGTICLVSSDDGVNAGGGMDGSGFAGFGPNNRFGGAAGGSGSAYSITISGGYLQVQAGGDGLDSNGTMTMSGGTVLVASTGNGDGALDYDSSFAFTGGTLLAVDRGAMSQAPSSAEQCTVYLGFGTSLPAGTYVALEGAQEGFVFELPVSTACLVFSSPELRQGGTYSVSYGGQYTGGTTGWICSGGRYEGGTVLTELTLSQGVNSYGTVGGMGGQMHGGTGGGRGQMEVPPGGIPGTLPEGTMPTMPGKGTMPEKGTMPTGSGQKTL